MLEDLKASIAVIMNEIAERPEERHVLQDALREKIAELRALGHAVPDDIRRLEEALDDPESGDLWDNLPV